MCGVVFCRMYQSLDGEVKKRLEENLRAKEEQEAQERKTRRQRKLLKDVQTLIASVRLLLSLISSLVILLAFVFVGGATEDSCQSQVVGPASSVPTAHRAATRRPPRSLR